ncbi:uncharacterized protein LOC111615617 [Centruroides sculpturatus]|uniref:uncharacterized protein LOC111615603 n=1 Tax=Centruroides sculpturatus TaxID=218467 RepID=UPI000C6D92A0|nr:uncharacterized protein LOC111615603 [Centruroides sculpturatus]XP_023212778.1 uncharacterized protein LOC111615603 [Centruroides sculpturatus]XP_023212796.1 uncharacterized protein LOC111615617 [Centruroides sculpturatus]
MPTSTTEDDYVFLKNMEGDQIRVLISDLRNRCPLFDLYFSIDPLVKHYAIYLPVSRQVLLALKSFLPRGYMPFMSVTVAMKTYRFSNVYKINNLKEVCRNYIRSEISVEDVCSVHDFACEQNDRLIQYECWIFFDRHWDEIFRTQDFLQSKETTIMRFLSRSIYDSLNEVSLFEAFYSWMKERVTRESPDLENRELEEKIRTEIRPFLSKIRFRAMTIDEAETYVFTKHVLTEIEVNSIRRCLQNHTFYNYPEYFCPYADERTEKMYDALFTYQNQFNPNNELETTIDVNTRFKCEIFVREDCYITSFTLPITFDHLRRIRIMLDGNSNSPKNNIPRDTFDCSYHGNVNLSKPIFLIKNSTTFLQFQILNSDDITRYDIRITPPFNYFYIANNSDIQPEDIDPGNNYYFEVVLYF